MPAASRGVPLDRLREAVEEGVVTRSLRGVAREVGMSPSGLQKFRDGSTPYTATRRKLERWYVRESAQYGRGTGTGSALAALHILTHDLPARERRQTNGAILDAIDTAYQKRRRRPPAWIGEIRRQLVEREE